MNETVKNTGLFVIVAGLIAITGFTQSWNAALLILNMGLISAIMALGVNLQWGFAGLFNIGIMGFVALGGLAAVLVAMPPTTVSLTTLLITLCVAVALLLGGAVGIRTIALRGRNQTLRVRSRISAAGATRPV